MADPVVGLDDLPIAVLSLAAGEVVGVNAHWSALTGRALEGSSGRRWLESVHGADLSTAWRLLQQADATGDGVGDLRLVAADGRDVVWVQAHVRLLRQRTAGGPTHVIALTEIGGRKTAEAELQHLASHDSLTGLLSRAAFVAEVEAVLAHASQTAALLFVDLDHFKEVNDELGHDSGDRVLVATCRRIRRTLRRSEVVGRLGGDEIGVLCPDIAAARDAIAVAERIVDVMHEPFVIDGAEVRLSVSVGVAYASPEQRATSPALLRSADQAMYRAKAAGRSRWAIAGRLAEPQVVIDLDDTHDAEADQREAQRHV